MWQPGGRHPIDIGDVIRDRYKIMDLLGGGTFSQVWLTEDLQYKGSGHGRQLVSLKVCDAEVVDYDGDVDKIPLDDFPFTGREADVLRHICDLKANPTPKSKYPDYYADGAQYIVDLYDSFTLKSPNGYHKCLVLEFAGPAIGEVFLALDFGLPPGLAEKIAMQLAQAVAFLQGCNVGHGDLHLSNILISPARVRGWGPKEAVKELGAPQPCRWDTCNPGPPHGPREIVLGANLGIWNRILKLNDHEKCDFSDYDIRVADFGQAFINKPPLMPLYMGIPPELAAPEVLIRNCLINKAIELVNTEPELDISPKDVEGSAEKEKKKSTDQEHKHVQDPPSEEKAKMERDTSPQQDDKGNDSAKPKDAPRKKRKKRKQCKAPDATPEEQLDIITDPKINPMMRLLALEKSSPFLEITPRSDLWSLGTTLFEIMLRRAIFSSAQGHSHLALYEIGMAFDVQTFKAIREEIDESWLMVLNKEHLCQPMARRLMKQAGFAGPVLSEDVQQAFLKLLKINSTERCSAVDFVDMLQEAWPHLKPPKKSTLLGSIWTRVWTLFASSALFRRIRRVWDYVGTLLDATVNQAFAAVLLERRIAGVPRKLERELK